MIYLHNISFKQKDVIEHDYYANSDSSQTEYCPREYTTLDGESFMENKSNTSEHRVSVK